MGEVRIQKPHVHGEWTGHDAHRHCRPAGWCCIRCGEDYGNDPQSCVRCGYTVLAPLWRFL